jgi:hypothetical protein
MSRISATAKVRYQIIVVGADISDDSLYGSKADALLAAGRIVRIAPQGAIVSVRQVRA